MEGWILVLDDDADNRELLAEFLEAQGYVVATSGSAAEANAVLDTRGRPSLVLSDVLLPDTRGTVFAEALRARAGFADTAVIFLTGMDSRSFEARAETVLLKPYDLTQLLLLVSQRVPTPHSLPGADLT